MSTKVFLDKSGKPKKFFEAAIGGVSVGVPATLKTLKLIHEDFGLLEWSKIVNYVIEFSKRGFIPSPRLLMLTKRKFLFKLNKFNLRKNYFSSKKFFNPEYTNTLKTISKNFSDFYNGNIARKIIKTVNQSIILDFLIFLTLNVRSKKQKALCYKLANGLKYVVLIFPPQEQYV